MYSQILDCFAEAFSLLSIFRFTAHRLAAAFPDRPMLQFLMLANLQRLSDTPCPRSTAENLAGTFRLSLPDCIIPFTLESRFSLQQSAPPVFRPGRNVLGRFLQPEVPLSPELLDRQAICPGRGGADPLRSVGCRALWPHPWHAFRDLIAAVTENRDYGRRGYKTFHDLRLL